MTPSRLYFQLKVLPFDICVCASSERDSCLPPFFLLLNPLFNRAKYRHEQSNKKYKKLCPTKVLIVSLCIPSVSVVFYSALVCLPATSFGPNTDDDICTRGAALLFVCARNGFISKWWPCDILSALLPCTNLWGALQKPVVITWCHYF